MLQIQAPLGSRRAESLFMKDEQKRWASDVFATFATYTNHVYDITDKDYWAQNGSTHGGFFCGEFQTLIK